MAAATAALAQSPEGLPAFGALGFAELRALPPAALAVPPAQSPDVISDQSLLVQAGIDVLFGYADTDAQEQQAVAYWTAALTAAGVQPGTPAYSSGMYQIPYTTGDGATLVSFLADARQFAPKDDAALRADMARAQAALTRNGLTPVASRVVDVTDILPTYVIIYKTKPDADPDHESRIRVLAPGDDLDFDVFRSAGLDVVETPTTSMMVYVGPAAGYVGLAAQTPDDLTTKLQAREAFLTQSGKKILATRSFSIDDADYPYGVGVYFLQ
jgi:hypothetical protein